MDTTDSDPSDSAPPDHPVALVAGFEPFDGAAVNPSWEAARPLDGQRLASGHRVIAACLPCVFSQVDDALHDLVNRWQPDLLLLSGLAASRRLISVERIAINVDDARIPDNRGAQPIDQPVAPDGPAAYFATVPIKAMALALTEAGFAAEISQTAGTFVCNHAFYAARHLQMQVRPAMRVGFIHLPPLETLPAAGASHALAVAATAALRPGGDLYRGGGRTD